MANGDPNLLFKALAKVRGIKTNLNPNSHEIRESYVSKYNQTVQEIAKAIKDDLGTFLVPENEIKSRMTSYNSATGKATYSSERYAEVKPLLIKCDSLMNYLEMLLGQQKPKPPFGFSTK